MHRQIQLIAVVFGIMGITGCCGGPMSQYQARECGARMASWMNSPACSHGKYHHHHHSTCPPGGWDATGGACDPWCGPVSSCDPCQVCGPVYGSPGPCMECDPCMQGYEESVPGAYEYDTVPAQPPAAPADPSPQPQPDPVGAASLHRVQPSSWVTQHPQVMLPGQRVSHRELRPSGVLPPANVLPPTGNMTPPALMIPTE